MRTSLCGVDIESQTSLGSTENGSELTALCAPEAYTGSKFSKSVSEHLHTGWIAVVHLCFSFFLWRQVAP